MEAPIHQMEAMMARRTRVEVFSRMLGHRPPKTWISGTEMRRINMEAEQEVRQLLDLASNENSNERTDRLQLSDNSH